MTNSNSAAGPQPTFFRNARGEIDTKDRRNIRAALRQACVEVAFDTDARELELCIAGKRVACVGEHWHGEDEAELVRAAHNALSIKVTKENLLSALWYFGKQNAFSGNYRAYKERALFLSPSGDEDFLRDRNGVPITEYRRECYGREYVPAMENARRAWQSLGIRVKNIEGQFHIEGWPGIGPIIGTDFSQEDADRDAFLALLEETFGVSFEIGFREYARRFLANAKERGR